MPYRLDVVEVMKRIPHCLGDATTSVANDDVRRVAVALRDLDDAGDFSGMDKDVVSHFVQRPLKRAQHSTIDVSFLKQVSIHGVEQARLAFLGGKGQNPRRDYVR